MDSSTHNTPIVSGQSRPGKLYIKNWKKFQHYTGRNPQWIKLHTNILRTPEWIGWSDATRLTAVCCLLVGSMDGGWIPDDPILLKRLTFINWRVDLKPLISCGFLTETLADASEVEQNACLDIEERREKRDREESKYSPAGKNDGTLADAAMEPEAVVVYPYVNGIIRLKAPDLERWQQAYSEINVLAELDSHAGWIIEQSKAGKNWFMAASGLLGKLNRQAIDRKAAIKIGVEAGVKPPAKKFFRV